MPGALVLTVPDSGFRDGKTWAGELASLPGALEDREPWTPSWRKAQMNSLRPYRTFLLGIARKPGGSGDCTRLKQTIERLFKILERGFGAALLDCFLHAILDVVLQDRLGDLIQRRANRRDLREHLVAVATLFPHPFQTVGM